MHVSHDSWDNSRDVIPRKSFVALLHFDQKSDGRHVGFSTLPCRMYDTWIVISIRITQDCDLLMPGEFSLD